MDDLPELRDIHLPDPIGLFPLGFGFISLLVCLVLGLVFFFVFRHYYLKSKKHYALEFIKKIEDKNIEGVRQISEMLRRICKIKHKKAVALYNKQWADFLNKNTTSKLPSDVLQILIDAPYAPSLTPVSDAHFTQIKEFALNWVEANL